MNDGLSPGRGNLMATKPIGRPMKYRKVIESLNDDDLHTPATIARHAMEAGLISLDHPDPGLARLRIRIALGRFSNNRQFPDEGDGMVTVPGQSPTPGWFGWRWKEGLVT